MLKKIILLAAMSTTFTGCLQKSHEAPDHVSQPNSISNKRIIDTVEQPLRMQATGTAIRLFVNGNQSTASPKVISGATYVPVRAAGELLKKTVSWDAATKTVYINDQNQSSPKPTSHTLKLIVNGKQATTAPKIINSVTYVPVRAAGELLMKYVTWDATIRAVYINTQAHSKVIYFPAVRYPQTSAHIKSAMSRGESPICTIARGGADHNREESLSGIPTKDGYDRDEFPMAMCAEGGAGADVAYVKSSDNRGAGSWVGNHMQSFPDGTRVLIVMDTNSGTAAPAKPIAKPTPKPTTTPKPATKPSSAYYKNCAAVRAAGKAPLRQGQPGYSTKLDRDHDGVACE